MIRLNKVARDLNVGIQTLIDFLQKNGYDDETFTPNTQITDDQYALLQKEFNADKSVKEGADKMSQVRHHKEKPVQRKVGQEPELVKTEEIKRPQFKQVGKIDLDAVNKRPAPKPAPVEKIEEVKPAPVETKAEQPKPTPVEKNEEVKPAPVENKQPQQPKPDTVEKKPEQTQKVEVNKEEDNTTPTEVFGFAKPQASTQLNIVGKIDLDSLNQKTRPQKKSKEERQKEREEKSVKEMRCLNAQSKTKKRERESVKNVNVSKKIKLTLTTPMSNHLREEKNKNLKR